MTLGPAARTALDGIAKVLAADPQARVTVEGYTDNAGNSAANLRISETRARVVRDYLVGAGVSASRIDAAGKGGTDPVAPNTTEAGWQQNRRVEIVIQP